MTKFYEPIDDDKDTKTIMIFVLPFTIKQDGRWIYWLF